MLTDFPVVISTPSNVRGAVRWRRCGARIGGVVAERGLLAAMDAASWS
jgi:hypothetical protein